MDLKILADIGLTDGEIKTYSALLKLGSSKTGPLVRAAGVSSSKIYKILDRLENKGLVGHVHKGKIKYFSAMKPSRILDYFHDKEAKMEEQKHLLNQLLPQFEKQYLSSKQTTEASLHIGKKAVTNFFRNILDELESGDIYYVIGATYGETPDIKPFFYNYHLERSKKNIRVKMLANFNERGNLVQTTQIVSEVRYLPQYLITNMTIIFYKSKVFIAIYNREPVGFLIESKEAVKSFQTYFDTFWKIAKK